MTGKRHALLNGRSDRDVEMNTTNSEIETIMSSAPQGKQDPRATPELIRSNSDVAALLSRRGRDLKDKIPRSRSIDPTKIQVNSSRTEKTMNSFDKKHYWHSNVMFTCFI